MAAHPWQRALTLRTDIYRRLSSEPSAEPIAQAIILQVLRLANAHAGRDQHDICSDPRSARSRGGALGPEGSGPRAGPGGKISGLSDGSDRQVAKGIKEH